LKDLIKDLADEYVSLDAFVAPLGAEAWDRETPFGAWTVRDQVCHLTVIDNAARLSVTDEEGFIRHRTELLKSKDFFEEPLKQGRSLSPGDLLAWWRREWQLLLDALTPLDPKARISWYGPPMSVRSLATSRLMETWAHGQDILDALGLNRPATDRLRHIAHLGVSTYGWSFKNRGMESPASPVRVELISPSGAIWSWGPQEAADIIRGGVEDFGLVITQRRHVDDTKLEVTGATARQWMLIAQAFAGPPASGPEAGRFRRNR
jgi:uncharacterized protein (TIGR03084 family)